MNLKEYKAFTPNKAPLKKPGVTMTGWRYGLFITTLVGLVGLAIYPVIVSPMQNPEQWQKVQKKTREGIDQEKIQPGGMRVWSSPFEKIPDSEKKK